MRDLIRAMELPEPCDDCGQMPINDITPKAIYRQYGECYCEEAEDMTTPEQTTATYTQYRIKCGPCGLHFIICTDYPESHATTTMYCPECGQHDGKFMVWQCEVEGFIFQAVPGLAPLININGNPIPQLTPEDIEKLKAMQDEIDERKKREESNE